MLLGNSLIWISLVLTALAMGLYFPGIGQGRTTPFLRQARWAVYGAAAAMVVALGYLWYLLLTHQFQFQYVFSYSARDMQLRYVISALWGGQEGTFLLWAGFAGLLAVFLRYKAKAYEPAVQFFYMGITLFLLLMLTKASPFKLMDHIPQDGRGLNPLLQDPWMTIHPPITFFGFASLGIPAAYAMAALIKEDWDQWIPRALPFTIFGVVALGTGLTLGGYWSYSILGWGGYWGWDPVENSSLVPWLIGIALLHTQIVQLRQGRYRKVNLLLSMMPFLFLTYSTFLTRSGVLADFSVHSFTDLGINQFLVAFMAIFLGGGLLLFLFKMKRVPVTSRELVFNSRESSLLWGSVAFALFGVIVIIGTSTPLISRLFTTPSSVQPEFYNRVVLPFAILISIIMAFGPHLMWNRTFGDELWKRIRISVLATVLLGIILMVTGDHPWSFLAVILTSAFAVFTNTQTIVSLAKTNWMSMGGALSHAGVGLMALGILFSVAYDKKELVELPKGQAVEAMGYDLQYLGRRPVENGKKQAYDISVTKDGSTHVTSPLMYYNDFNASMMKKPAIRSFLTHDIYIAPGGMDIETVAERTSVSMQLGKGESQTVRGITMQFERFDMGAMPEGHGQNGHGGHAAHAGGFAAILTATVDGVKHSLRPEMIQGQRGIQPGPPILIPGTEFAVQLEGIDANNSRVGLNVGYPPIVLSQHGTGTLKGYEIHFGGYEIKMLGNNQASVMAEVQVTDPDGNAMHLNPGFIDRREMEREHVEAPLGSSGLNLVMTEIDSQTGQAAFNITRAPHEAVWVEASYKPLIGLLWLGTGLVTFGMILSTAYRGKEKSRPQVEDFTVLDRKQGVA